MIKVKRPKRWDKPFVENMSDKVVSHILSLPPLNNLNPDDFRSGLALSDIIANDTRTLSYQTDDVIVRKGEYGSSSFLLLSGEIGVITGDFELPTQTNKFNFLKSRKKAVFDFPLFFQTDKVKPLTISPEFQQFLQQNPKHCTSIQPYGFYGEIAALIRGTQQATLFAKTKLVVLEIRWQGLRDLMRHDANLRKHIQDLYRKNNLLVQLRSISFFSHLNEEQLNNLSQQCLFLDFGEFEWQHSFKNITNKPPEERLKSEPIIAKEGDYINGMFLICSGFSRLSKKVNHGEKTLGYLKQGDYFGLKELAHNRRSTDRLKYQNSLRAIGYVSVIRIPTIAIEQYALPNIHQTNAPLLKDTVTSDYGLNTNLLEQLVEQRFINGTSTMVIDQYRCTGCDDCVSACASLHNNQPLFTRQGSIIDQYLITHACMHCTDPVCLIGCPTGAIHRNEKNGNILIDDNTCIGCSGCANSCPYENIFMSEAKNTQGQSLLDKETGNPLLKAKKCDLCAEHNSIPACEQACPHDALKRLDMGNIASIADWFNR